MTIFNIFVYILQKSDFSWHIMQIVSKGIICMKCLLMSSFRKKWEKLYFRFRVLKVLPQMLRFLSYLYPSYRNPDDMFFLYPGLLLCWRIHSRFFHSSMSFIHMQGLTNPLPSCPGQVQILAGQVIFYFTCPEKCIEDIRNIVIPSYFLAAVDCRASGWNEFVRPCICIICP